MRLTQTLCKYKPLFIGKIPKFPGSALKGKHRYVPAATRATRYLLWLDWKNEEEVLKYISKPYITEDEEQDYLESIGRTHQDVDPLYTSVIQAPMRQSYGVNLLRVFERNRQFEVVE